jgi:hypothetical protein
MGMGSHDKMEKLVNPVILFSTRASNAATIYIDTHKNYTSQLNNIYTIQTITYKKR